MAGTKREKIISYRRAEWLIDNPGSIKLASLIKQMSAKLTTVAARTIVRDGQNVCLAGLNDQDPNKGLYLHFTVETPGEFTSIVPKKARNKSAIEITTAAPPPDGEYMDGDAFLYVHDNDVCLCATNVRDGTIRIALQELFTKADLRHDATKFDLMKVANVSKLKLIQSQGVKEIEIKATMHQATFNYEKRKNQTVSILASAIKQFKSILGKDNDYTNDALKIALILKSDRRMHKGIVLGEQRLETLAKSLVNHQESQDDYIIVTKGDQRIGPDEIYMKTKMLIDSKAKSVDRDKAWKAVRSFYNDLKTAGALEY